MAKLVVKSGRNTGEEYVLSEDRLILGRRSSCPIPIVDVKASREHAAVFHKNNEIFIQDLSRNGTLVNSLPVSKSEQGTLLKFGDRIKIGETELELVDETKEPINIDIPNYQILARVGQGGMGAVYKARQMSMDRIVAIKVLNERYASNPEFRDRFTREARAAGKLNHPNVIHVHDISSANGRHYFSMEFVDGPSVKEMLRAGKRIEVNRALDIVLQTAKALEFAHENKVVHRDVKPDNIMLTKEGIVKLADLGIAKTFEEKQATEKERRRVMGTPHYMAPEQALGKAIDHRVDIYSLGATLYHMVTGKTPFAGNSAHEILKAHIQESLPPIQDLNPAVPDHVCFIVERMMAKLPEKRYPDMTRVIADIEKVQRGASAGIARLEAGESAVLRTAKQKEEAKEEKASGLPPQEEDAEEPKSDTAELPTDLHLRIRGILLVAGLVLVFAGVVAGVVYIASHVKKPGVGTEGAEGGGVAQPGGGGGETPEDRSNPEAKKLLKAAEEAQRNNDPSEFERLLKELQVKYPTSPEAAEGKRRLDEGAKRAQEEGRKVAEKLLKEAKSFEAANPTSLSETIKKYKSAADAARDFPNLAEEAKAKVDALQKRAQTEQGRAVDAALRTATEAANAAKARSDYDAARTALQEFIKANATAPQKGDADAALEKTNAEATARLKEVQDAAANLDVVAALGRWAKYTEEVKDAVAANDAKTACQALEAKADKLTQEELDKASEKAKKYNYTDPLSGIRALLKRLTGLKKCEELLKAKEESLRRQEDIHKKFVAAAAEKLKAGAVPLPFNVETRFGDMKWKATRIASDHVELDAMAAGTPGITKRLGDMKPDEQYKLYLLFLPKDSLSADDKKSLEAFCQERGVTGEK
ncbi:MAG: protein kinase [Planctomycetota bacterium]